MSVRPKSAPPEAILQAILESPRDIVIIALDREYRYLAFNEAHRRVMKQIWNVDIRLGQNMLEDVVGREDDRVRAKASFDRALAGEHFVLVEEYGDEAFSRRIYEDAYGPIRDEAGDVVGLTIYLTDVTEQRLAQRKLEEYRARLETLVAERTAALQRNEELYRRLVANAPIAAMVHRGALLLSVNPAAKALLAPGDGERLVGRSLAELVAPAVVDRLERAERLRGEEVALCRGDGEVVLVEWTSIPVDFEGTEASFSLLVDVTARRAAERERERMEQQIRHAQKLESLGVLAGGIAHDFNNLLVGVLGNVEGALRRLDAHGLDDGLLRTQLERAKLSAKRAAELTSRMLAYAGKGAYAVGPVDLNALALEMRELLGVSLASSTRLAFDLDEELAPIEGDAAQLRQVIMNLVTNAADAIGEAPGTVTVRTRRCDVDRALIAAMFVPDAITPGPHVCLDVTDTGAGMDERTRASLFDPFFSTKAAGRGLGLATVLGIVRGHRGGLLVKSTPGHGSTFRIFFPRPTQPLPHPAPRAAPIDLDTWRGGGLVVVADDQPRVRDVLRMLLRELGFDVVEAVDAVTCLERYRAHEPDVVLVIVDLMMPGGGGQRVVTDLRAAGADVPVIVSSGYSEDELRPEIRRDPRVRFLVKPYELETLVKTVHDALAAV